MNTLRRVLVCTTLMLLVLSGCDTLEDTAPETEQVQEATLDSEQADASLVSEDVQALLLDDGPLEETSLHRIGFRLQGAVFTLSDAPEGNEVLAFERALDGSLTPAGAYPTNGLGSGDGLNGTSNPIALALGNRYLYAVNGGSDEISIFRVHGASLAFVGTVASGGPRPISITVHRRLVFVLNAGRPDEPGNITGFRILDGGRLHPLRDATRPLNEGAGSPSQIDFNPWGTLLVITDKPTNTITTYAVQPSGRTGPPNVQPSNGQTAFGFDFDRYGRLFVSEAFGGALDASAVSSYAVGHAGDLRTISASVPTTETAACWVEVFGHYAYTTNAGSNSITGYRIGREGTLTRLDEDGVTVFTGAGSGPLDMAIALRYLYVHLGGTNHIGVYQIDGSGGLTAMPGAASGLPSTAVGVAAY